MAQGIVAAMEGDSFEHYVPDMRAIVESKTADPDPFIKGMAAMLRSGPGLATSPGRPPDPTRLLPRNQPAQVRSAASR